MKWLLYGLLVFPGLASAEDVAKRLERANAGVGAAWRAGDAGALTAHYAADAVLMPEHSAVRRGDDEVGSYYAALFDALQVQAYRRTSHDVVVYGDHAVQTGNYELAFAADGGARTEFKGKFMALWDLRQADPKLVCELWGTDAPFERAKWPEIAAPPDAGSRAPVRDAKLFSEVTARNALIGKLVTERRGAEHAELFLADAIYLTYYTPMLVGIEQIREYFIGHERPGEVAIDSLDLSSGNLHRLQGDDVVLEEGFYRVAWRAGGDQGVVKGKSLNLWKRDESGVLRLFRQAVNHD
ncbi:MAG TPA: nuclear transport factor 2 family protein [Stenotrophomonas sp.]|nr:nuclear transport factor 2 family protein [Stenotrophomonas sp.]